MSLLFDQFLSPEYVKKNIIRVTEKVRFITSMRILLLLVRCY